MGRPSNIIVATIKRNQRFRGPTSSEQQNDFQAEVIRDLASIQQEWNTKIVPLTKILPNGIDDPLVDAFINGLDGRTLYVSAEATATLSNGKFYNSVKDRPNTAFEQFVNLYTYIDDQVLLLQDLFNNIDVNGGLTTAQKTRIGDNIFDLSLISSGSSLDGRLSNQNGYIQQIAKDLYGVVSPTLNTNGDTILTNSVKAMVDALLELHNGDWDTDVSVSHTLTASDITITDVHNHFTALTVEDALDELAETKLTIFDPVFTTTDLTLGDHSQVYVNAGSTNVLISLPDVSNVPARIYTIKKIDNTANFVTISGLVSDTIDGAPNYVLTDPMQTATVQATISGYFLI